MAHSIIRKGYRITVVSWENDADNYRTEVKEGHTEAQARFVCEVLNHMGSQSNGGREQNQFGNMYEPDDDEMEEFAQYMMRIVESHGDAAVAMVGLDDEDRQLDEDDLPYAFTEFLYDYMGGGEFFTRVVESIKVEWIPEDILIEDVTEDFVD